MLGVVGAFDRRARNDGKSAQRAEQRVAEGDAAVSELAPTVVAPGSCSSPSNDALGARQATGVCVRHSGDILTSAAIIGDATTAQVTTTTGETVDATVVGRDDATGLVLLHSERPLRAVPVSEETSHAGDSVWVFGAQSPKEGSPWISSGIVSSADAVVANAPGPMTGGLLETDALGTAGTAGGALVDRTGAVNGIVLWPQGEHRSAYAVPIDTRGRDRRRAPRERLRRPRCDAGRSQGLADRPADHRGAAEQPRGTRRICNRTT